jgi:hypothetical protein
MRVRALDFRPVARAHPPQVVYRCGQADGLRSFGRDSAVLTGREPAGAAAA